jgi:peptide alpha-N-acetyltransferase
MADLVEREYGCEYEYRSYDMEYLDAIYRLIEKDLSEPYSIFTYHYFVHEHPHLCRTAWVDKELVGVIIGRISMHREARRGYIGMLATAVSQRGRGVGLDF